MEGIRKTYKRILNNRHHFTADKLLTLWLFLIIVFVYIYLSKTTRFYYADSSPFAYYNWLCDAFLNGRLNVQNPPYIHDLSLFNDKYYLYWGPAPVLFILPFYLAGGGLETSDFIYSLAAGILNVAMFYFILLKFIKIFELKLQKLHIYILWLMFSFTSPNLYCAISGGVWQTSQIIGISYLLASVLTLFHYWKTEKLKFLTISLVFFNLAWLSRYTLILYFPLYFVFYKHNKLKESAYLLLITSIFVVALLFYNYGRFGNLLDLGTRYMQSELWIMNTEKDIKENVMLKALHSEGKQYSLTHVPRGIYYHLLNPVLFSFTQPYVKTDSMGNGIFFIYPPLILVFGIMFRRAHLTINAKKFIKASLIICVLNIFNLLTYIGTGYHQVGNRYMLDILPVLILTTAFTIKNIPLWTVLVLLIYGSLLHIFALTAYYLGGIYF